MTDEPIDYGVVNVAFNRVARFTAEQGDLRQEAQLWPEHEHGFTRIFARDRLKLAPLGFFVVREV